MDPQVSKGSKDSVRVASCPQSLSCHVLCCMMSLPLRPRLLVHPFSQAKCRNALLHLVCVHSVLSLPLSKWTLSLIHIQSSELGNKTTFFNALNAESSLDWLSTPCKESKVSFYPLPLKDLLPFLVHWLPVFSCELLISFPCTFFLDDHNNCKEFVGNFAWTQY